MRYRQYNFSFWQLHHLLPESFILESSCLISLQSDLQKKVPEQKCNMGGTHICLRQKEALCTLYSDVKRNLFDPRGFFEALCTNTQQSY